MTTKKQKSLKINATLNMIKTLMSLIFPLITFPYTSRTLEPFYIGKINFAKSIVSYFSLLAGLGISSYAIRETAKFRENRENLTSFVREIFILNMISTFISYCLFFIAMTIIPQFSEYRKLLCIISSTILFTTLGMDWLYIGLEEFTYITIRSISFQFLSLALLFLLVKSKDDYLKYACIGVISNVGSNILNFLHARKFINLELKLKTKILLRKHLKPVFTLFAMSVTISVYTLLDTTMIGFIKGDEAVGLYTAATKLNRMIIMLVTAAIAVLLPRLSYYAKSDDKTEFIMLSNNSLQFILFFSIPCAVGLFILAEPIILFLCGEKYLNSIAAMKIMNFIIILIPLSGLIGTQIFMAIGKEKFTVVSVICGAIVNFTLNAFLIKKFSVNGAAIATVLAETVVTAVQIVFARKLLKWKEISIHLIQIIFSCLFMAIAVYFITSLFNNYAVKIVVGISTGFAVYLIFLFIFRNRFLINFIVQLKGKRNTRLKIDA